MMSWVPSLDHDAVHTPRDLEKFATALCIATAFVNVIVTTSPTLKSTITGGGFEATADTIPGQLRPVNLHTNSTAFSIPLMNAPVLQQRHEVKHAITFTTTTKSELVHRTIHPHRTHWTPARRR